VRILSERRYRFAAPPPDVWAALADVDRYAAWWPWLRRFDAQALVPGVSWRCTIRPPLPYVLRCRIDLVTVEAPRLVSARVWGDLLGRAAVSLGPSAEEDSTDVRFVTALAARSLPARLGAKAFPATARRAHDWVFDAGARQFAEANGWCLQTLER
jgi:uncharacterized protein YndB with AHSA1/START domain